jgi:tRNA (cytidine/uridine-2'-O-)-methyltransferase
MKINVLLYEPEIPQNTGTIGRTCMAAGASLHLIEPLGFSLEDKYLKRAGLDYWKDLDYRVYSSWNTFKEINMWGSFWFFTTKAYKNHTEGKFVINNNNVGTDINTLEENGNIYLVFGKETAGLPDNLLKGNIENCLRIPLLNNARSLNLAVSVGIAVYEVLRQNNFAALSSFDPENRLNLRKK